MPVSLLWFGVVILLAVVSSVYLHGVATLLGSSSKGGDDDPLGAQQAAQDGKLDAILSILQSKDDLILDNRTTPQWIQNLAPAVHEVFVRSVATALLKHEGAPEAAIIDEVAIRCAITKQKAFELVSWKKYNNTDLANESSRDIDPSLRASEGSASNVERIVARPYWSLSCPLEWYVALFMGNNQDHNTPIISNIVHTTIIIVLDHFRSKYSCVHQRKYKEANLSKAFAWSGRNLELAQEALDNAAVGGALKGRRVIVVGDSLARQVFISLGCLLHPLTEARRVGWMAEWPCSGAKCRRGGEHGGFNKASILLKDGGEVHFFGVAGSWLGREEEPNVASRWHREHTLTGNLTFGSLVKPMAKSGESSSVLGPADVILANAGIHSKDLSARCSDLEKFAALGADLVKDPTAPRFIYLKTPSQHFATADGTHDPKLVHIGCKREIDEDPRHEAEQLLMVPGVTVDGFLGGANYAKTGLMHLGNVTGKDDYQSKIDCSHYCKCA